MRKLILTTQLILCLLSKESIAQSNLIPNPSFEDTVACDISGAPSVANWVGVANSPDYFNSIAYPYCWFTGDVPSNPWGYQSALNANAYIGIATWGSSPPNYREWIQTQLNDTLIVGKKYCTSFYVNLVNNCTKASDEIGAYFSDTTIEYYGPPFFEFPSQVNNPQGNFITDTTNWSLISGIYTAGGGKNTLPLVILKMMLIQVLL